MKLRTLEVWVGLFVILGIASLMMLIMQVSGLHDIYSKEQSFPVKAIFSNIGGLKARSKVTIAGVNIGRVEEITLQQNEYGEYQAIVSLSLKKQFNKIPKDSIAKILTSGLLGDNYIGIEPGMADEFLDTGSTIELTSQALLLEDLISKFAVDK